MSPLKKYWNLEPFFFLIYIICINFVIHKYFNMFFLTLWSIEKFSNNHIHNEHKLLKTLLILQLKQLTFNNQDYISCIKIEVVITPVKTYIYVSFMFPETIKLLNH